MVWYRYLFVVFSSYSWVNFLRLERRNDGNYKKDVGRTTGVIISAALCVITWVVAVFNSAGSDDGGAVGGKAGLACAVMGAAAAWEYAGSLGWEVYVKNR